MRGLNVLYAGVAVFLALTLSVTLARAADQQAWRLNVQSKIVDTERPARENVPGNRNTKLAYQTVLLFPDLVSVKDDQSQTIYNFQTKELIYLNLADSTYFATSIYAIPAFNVMEKANQSMIVEGLAATGTPMKQAPERFDLDMQFGGKTNPDDFKGLEMIGDAKSGSYKFRGEDIAGFEMLTTPVPDGAKKSFARYITYQYSMHPVIKRNLLSTGMLYKSLRFTNHGINPMLSDKTYTIADSKVVNERLPVIPSTYTMALPGKEPVLKILAAAAVDRTDYVDAIRQLVANKKYSDAAMAFIGHVNVNGNDRIDQLKPVLASLMQEAPPESRVKEILKICSSQPTKLGNPEKITFLQAAQAASPDYGYFLAGCMALYQQADGKIADAQATRIATLTRNPGQISVLKDLGDGYYRQSDTFTAWAIWNKARKLNPNHPAIKSVEQLEQAISKDMPEYF